MKLIVNKENEFLCTANINVAKGKPKNSECTNTEKTKSTLKWLMEHCIEILEKLFLI